MTIEFTVSMVLADDSVLAPGADMKFLSRELCGFTAALAGYYTAGSEPPEVGVSVPDWPTKPKINAEGSR